MKSLLLVFCISAMVAAEALPAAAQLAPTCTQRLALCNGFTEKEILESDTVELFMKMIMAEHEAGSG